MRSVFIVTGPAGVGKSTAAGIVARSLEKSALLTGDAIYHFVVGGRIDAGTPGEIALPYYNLLYRNLISLTENNLAFGNDVVVDYILDYRTILSLIRQVRNPAVWHYSVLVASEAKIQSRDAERLPSDRCWPRSLEHLTYLTRDCPSEYVIRTDELAPTEVARLVVNAPPLPHGAPHF